MLNRVAATNRYDANRFWHDSGEVAYASVNDRSSCHRYGRIASVNHPEILAFTFQRFYSSGHCTSDTESRVLRPGKYVLLCRSEYNEIDDSGFVLLLRLEILVIHRRNDARGYPYYRKLIVKKNLLFIELSLHSVFWYNIVVGDML